ATELRHLRHGRRRLRLREAGGPVPRLHQPAPFAITGDAPAYGTHVGDDASFQTLELSTPNRRTREQQDQRPREGHSLERRPDLHPLLLHLTVPSPDATGVGRLNDKLVFDITGGTGHFSNASGNGHLTATGNVYFDPRPTIVASELKGTITH